MKRIFLVLLILASFSSVYAADKAADASSALKLTGDLYVGGNMAQDAALVKSSKKTFSYFDYDLNLNAAFKANDNATVFVRLTYDKDATGGSQAVPMGDGSATNPGLAVERAYLNYKFNPQFQLDAGLMAGGQWGTLYGNTEANVLRLKGTFTAAEGMDFIVIYQKNSEEVTGSTSASPKTIASTSEKNDDNTYYLGAKLNFAPIKIQPLFSYQTKGVNYADGTANNEGDYTKMGADVAVLGDLGTIGFESEFTYFAEKGKKASKPVAPLKDAKTMGAYVNIFTKIDPATIGFVYAYASDKSDKGEGKYNWGRDFNVTVVMDDVLEKTLAGWSVYKLYANAKSDAISYGVALAYGADNVKKGKGTFSEIDANFGYALDAQTDYTINAGYAMTSKTTAAQTKANCFAMYHGIKIKF